MQHIKKMFPVGFLILVVLFDCCRTQQVLKKQLADLHYQLFKTVQNQTSLIKTAVFETQCSDKGCTFNGCNSEGTCGNQMMDKLKEIQNSVDSIKNGGNILKGCKSGWNLYKGHCYKIFKPGRNWFEAQMVCREHGATLVQIDDRLENQWIMKNFPKVRFWLDHSDVGTEGRWKLFSTGKTPTFSNWSRGQPDNHRGVQDCGYSYFVRSGVWDDGNCAAKFQFICESSGSLC